MPTVLTTATKTQDAHSNSNESNLTAFRQPRQARSLNSTAGPSTSRQQPTAAVSCRPNIGRHYSSDV